ncbi:hypothetical protein GCM10009737_37850 [Nocardioides lentus]|uniref:MinD-like ATPase involved in chromosome partitioning or flagellar assembly n=1 Tax=Nocardioides lentus TaxID=338077 RepID=A0ABP5B5K4_9ACTN
MSQDHTDGGPEPDTSERLYTTGELEEYGARLEQGGPTGPVGGDPLTDPYTDGRPDAHEHTRVPGGTQESPAVAPTAGPAPAAPAGPTGWQPQQPGPQQVGPQQPRQPAGPPAGWAPAGPASAPGGRRSGPPAPTPQGPSAPQQQHPQQQPPQQQPAPRAPQGGPPQHPQGPPARSGQQQAAPGVDQGVDQGGEQGGEPGGEGEVRRFMTATDFLDRRADIVEYGPASWGWRGKVRRWSGGLIKPQMSAKEMVHEDHRRVIQRDFDGPRTIAFLNPKGGAAKTTGVLAAGYTFGTVRGGAVVAWDNNETRGTLGIRAMRSTHRNTTRELLEDLEKFSDVYQSRIGDLGAFVRAQGDAHFDVLASDERPDVTGTIRATDFTAVHQLLERFYRIILVDTGNNMRAENWLAAAEAADLLVVTSTVREDTGYSGLWMLDALQDAGYQNLKYRTITVLSDPSPNVDSVLAHDLMQVYQQRTREVYRVPYDPALVSGSEVPYAQLSRSTTDSWLRACAGMASAL